VVVFTADSGPTQTSGSVTLFTVVAKGGNSVVITVTAFSSGEGRHRVECWDKERLGSTDARGRDISITFKSSWE
jgi:hypothetical protein